MKFRSGLIVVLALAGVLLFQNTSRAEIYRLSINFLTTIYQNPATGNADPSSQQVCADIIIKDSKYRSPDALKSLTVTAPDNTTFTFTGSNTPNLSWLEFSDEFWFSAKASNFTSGKIPSGVYKVTAIDLGGKTLQASDNFTVAYLDVPKVVSPADGQLLGSLTPKFTWSAVPGAACYRILLLRVYSDGSQDPVYWFTPEDIKITTSTFVVPKGILNPQSQYMIRIEARDSDGRDLNKRSRSKWIHFHTP